MIRSFASKATERIWQEHNVRGVDRNVQRATLRKRVNAQWRIRFRWRDGGADDVELVDSH